MYRLILLATVLMGYFNTLHADEPLKRSGSADVFIVIKKNNGNIRTGDSVTVRPARLGEQDRRVSKKYESRVEPIPLRESGVPCYDCRRK